MAFKTDLEALVLGILQQQPLHGYQIAKRIKLLSDTALSVGEGQLYPILHKLERDALVEADWIPQEGKPPRKVYHLTEQGRSALVDRQNEWSRFAESVSAILKPLPTQPEAICG